MTFALRSHAFRAKAFAAKALSGGAVAAPTEEGGRELREDGGIELREDGSIELREGVFVEPARPSSGAGGRWVVKTLGVPIVRPWKERSEDAVATGAELLIELELVAGVASVFYVELIACEARGQVIYDREMIAANLLAIAGSF